MNFVGGLSTSWGPIGPIKCDQFLALIYVFYGILYNLWVRDPQNKDPWKDFWGAVPNLFISSELKGTNSYGSRYLCYHLHGSRTRQTNQVIVIAYVWPFLMGPGPMNMDPCFYRLYIKHSSIHPGQKQYGSAQPLVITWVRTNPDWGQH